MIKKEIVWKGIKLEMAKDEICKIYQAGEYERDAYYDYNLILDVLNKVLHKQIDFELFSHWCILIGNCFSYPPIKSTKKLVSLYNVIADMFDGYSFDDEYNEKRILGAIARLNHYNHLIENVNSKKYIQFTTDGVERLLNFDHCNQDQESSVYLTLIIDHNKNEFDLRYVDDGYFTFDEKINYSFVSKNIINKRFNTFFEEDNEWHENHCLKF